eukprot:CAMPEP_0181467000 /NCGR_PEP_ID=MMETSP1110-20121109/36748_1 /TAXON_ID=174948 /ORGANISM="Symbiodinium sp., Strain CCMP421" /LENGTH=52 /DNA_ID=CAMNT_0023591803 /DNA_START=564 /DNA_END=718 /DNA_ORIENTATION=+
MHGCCGAWVSSSAARPRHQQLQQQMRYCPWLTSVLGVQLAQLGLKQLAACAA